MHRLMLWSNGVMALFFAGFFAYTFLARDRIDALARNFVTEETRIYASPVVDLASEALKNKLVQKLLTAVQVAAIQREIDDYRRDPRAFVSDLMRKADPIAPQHANNPMLQKSLLWKQNVRDYYNKVLGRLILDLRIFSGSNCVAAALSIWLAWRRSETTKRQVWISFLLLVAVVMNISMYVDHMSFFTILFNSYIGWWYPAGILLLFLILLAYFPHDNADTVAAIPAKREQRPIPQ